jgi:hypothetical protein
MPLLAVAQSAGNHSLARFLEPAVASRTHGGERAAGPALQRSLLGTQHFAPEEDFLSNRGTAKVGELAQGVLGPALPWRPHVFRYRAVFRHMRPIEAAVGVVLKEPPANLMAPEVLENRPRREDGFEDRQLRLRGGLVRTKVLGSTKRSTVWTNITGQPHVMRHGATIVRVALLGEHSWSFEVCGLGWNPIGLNLLNESAGARYLFPKLAEQLNTFIEAEADSRTVSREPTTSWRLDHASWPLPDEIFGQLMTVVTLLKESRQPGELRELDNQTAPDMIRSFMSLH